MNQSPEARSIAVIGGGIVGLSAAMQLLIDGYDVTVFDKDEPMQACSAGNAGYLSEANIFPPASPDMLWQMPRLLLAKEGPLVINPRYVGSMLPWSRSALKVLKPSTLANVTDTLAGMTRMAFGAITALARQANAQGLLTRDGGLVAYKTVAGLEKKSVHLPTWNGYGLTVRRLSAVEVQDMEPALAKDIVGGLLFENSGRCSNPQGLGLQYAEHLALHGAQILRSEVGGVLTQPDGRVLVQSTAGNQVFDQVVVCAGFWSGPLLKPYFKRVPLISERGYHLMLPKSGISLKRPVVFGEPHFAATTMDDGLRLAGTAEFASADSPANWGRARMLLSLAKQYLRHVEGEGAKQWMGVRPSLPDGLPAIGTVRESPSIHYAFGHAHNGLTLSAVSAMCISALVRQSLPPVDIAPMRLERFG
jgi:glycine/D-amino acid oxidase-like deaminating enzyme